MVALTGNKTSQPRASLPWAWADKILKNNFAGIIIIRYQNVLLSTLFYYVHMFNITGF